MTRLAAWGFQFAISNLQSAEATKVSEQQQRIDPERELQEALFMSLVNYKEDASDEFKCPWLTGAALLLICFSLFSLVPHQSVFGPAGECISQKPSLEFPQTERTARDRPLRRC